MALSNAERQRRHRERQRLLAEAERGARQAHAELQGDMNTSTLEGRIARARRYAERMEPAGPPEGVSDPLFSPRQGAPPGTALSTDSRPRGFYKYCGHEP